MTRKIALTAFMVKLTATVTPILELRRVPLFLRFVATTKNGKPSWDALDQLDDEPGPHETVTVGRRIRAGDWDTMHIKFSKPRKSGWYAMVDYVTHDTQPPGEIVRDRHKWQAWCVQEQQRIAGKDGPTPRPDGPSPVHAANKTDGNPKIDAEKPAPQQPQ